MMQYMLTFRPYHAISIASESETEMCFKVRSHKLQVCPINHRSCKSETVIPHKQILQPSDKVGNGKHSKCVKEADLMYKMFRNI
jgi:hypothetical protein